MNHYEEGMNHCEEGVHHCEGRVHTTTKETHLLRAKAGAAPADDARRVGAGTQVVEWRGARL